ncbi:MAG: helix-turn-helix domain-containing protein [Lachnospiraceae bacterium]|nr:helix-turn-helix domain-containing protein [Lachnospiraceae bacterium]
MMKVNTLSDERTIGYHISRIIMEKGQTAEQAADSMEISEMRLRAIMTGSTSVQEEELIHIADMLDVRVEELLQPISDEDLKTNNLHCMGTATDPENLNRVLDKIDMYVRLLDLQAND